MRQFNKQEVGESAETFITVVQKLAEHCKYGILHEETIQDGLLSTYVMTDLD